MILTLGCVVPTTISPNEQESFDLTMWLFSVDHTAILQGVWFSGGYAALRYIKGRLLLECHFSHVQIKKNITGVFFYDILLPKLLPLTRAFISTRSMNTLLRPDLNRPSIFCPVRKDPT